ncbi:MAG: MGMT family protein [Candidatus Moraniibacteriota bacterium]|nr:MAG: MGMT family protein [Candidatus Moranbacteria bacterium]
MIQPKKQSFRERVYRVVARIPRGRVLSYSEVARLAGRPGAARSVGTAMKENSNPKQIPCHRVVRADGSIGEYAFGGPKAKLEKLKREGVKFLTVNRVKISSLVLVLGPSVL